MRILLSVLLFVFNSLFFQGFELSDTPELITFQEDEQLSSEIESPQLHSLHLEDFDLQFILIEYQEKEEKIKPISIPLFLLVKSSGFSVSSKDYIDWQTSFFSSKPKLEGLHLYDLFGYWKTHLA